MNKYVVTAVVGLALASTIVPSEQAMAFQVPGYPRRPEHSPSPMPTPSPGASILIAPPSPGEGHPPYPDYLEGGVLVSGLAMNASTYDLTAFDVVSPISLTWNNICNSQFDFEIGKVKHSGSRWSAQIGWAIFPRGSGTNKVDFGFTFVPWMLRTSAITFGFGVAGRTTTGNGLSFLDRNNWSYIVPFSWNF